MTVNRNTSLNHEGALTDTLLQWKFGPFGS